MPRKPRTKATVNYEIDTPYLIKKKLTPKEQRAEYTILRDIVNKRIKRAEKRKVKPGEADFRRSGFYERWKGGVPKLSEIKGDRLPYLLSALKKDVQDPGTTAKGYQEAVAKRVKGLHKAGFSFVTAENFADFTEFMERYRAEKLDHIYGSVEVAKFWKTVEKKNIDYKSFFDNFEEFMANREAISRMRKPMQTGKFEEYKAWLQKNKRWKEVKKRRRGPSKRRRASRKKKK